MKDPATLISAALEDAEHAEKVGMFRIKTANQAVADAARRPDPEDLYHELWFEGEVCFRLTRRHIVGAARKVIEGNGRRGNHRMLHFVRSKLVAALRFREQI